MNTSVLALVASLSLAACSAAGLADRPHTVADYYADAQLSADTIEACRARNEAEYRVMQAKPACANVRAAEQQRWDDAARQLSGASSGIEERKAERNARLAAMR